MKQTKRSRSPLAIPEKTDVRTGTAEEDGVVLLLYRVETPLFDAASCRSDAASFYEKVAEKCEKYLTGRLADLLREEYRASDPARRRFGFRCAVYAHAVGIKPDGDAFTIERTVTLKRAGRLLFSRVFYEKWGARDGKPIPLPDEKEKRRNFREKKREKG